MASAVKETVEIYSQEIHSKEALGWFFAHCRRFLEMATSQGKKMTVSVANNYYFVTTLDDLSVARTECFYLSDNGLLRDGGVHGRVTFTS